MDSSNNYGPTKESIELMKQTYAKVAPDITKEDQNILKWCIEEAESQYEAKNTGDLKEDPNS